jgi:hypothetical protein
MSYTYWKIERYAFSDNVWSSTAETLTDFHDPTVSAKLGEAVDNFSFKITNFNNEYDNYFNASDKIVISRKLNSSAIDTSDVLITGIVNNIPNDDSYNQNFLRVEGVNFSESLARALVFVDANGLTIPQFIQQALQHVQAYNDNFAVTWHPDNPTLTTEDEAFPVVTERWYNKSLLKLLEEYSSKEVTGDVNYYWYVDVDNKLVWRPKTDVISYTFDASTDDYKSLKTKKDIKDVYNFVIMKGGYTPANQPISTRVVNNVSLAKHGFKPYIIVSKTNYAENLMSLDLGAEATSRYPTGYPFDTKWVSSLTSTDSPTATKGSVITVTSDAEYNSAVRREAKYLLQDEANRFLDERGQGKLMLDITFDAGKGWSVGDVIDVTIPAIGKTSNPMRVQEAVYHVDTDKFTLIEDEGTI